MYQPQLYTTHVIDACPFWDSRAWAPGVMWSTADSYHRPEVGPGKKRENLILWGSTTTEETHLPWNISLPLSVFLGWCSFLVMTIL